MEPGGSMLHSQGLSKVITTICEESQVYRWLNYNIIFFWLQENEDQEGTVTNSSRVPYQQVSVNSSTSDDDSSQDASSNSSSAHSFLQLHPQVTAQQVIFISKFHKN